MINIFGGSSAQPAGVSYRAFALSGPLQLQWPGVSDDEATVAARAMDVTPDNSPTTALLLPQASGVGVGYDLVITNVGAAPLTVKNYQGTTTIASIAPGVSQYVQVTSNATDAGVWRSFGFGAGVSAVTAGALVGPGIGASGTSLFARQPVLTFSANNAVSAADRANMYVWTGGAGTQTLPTAGSVGADFFYSLRNQGTGALTVAAQAGETIDGLASIVLQPTESADLHSGGGNAWYTVGRGRSVQFSFTLLVKAITGGTVVLTPTEAANVVQRYTGTLVSNAEIVLPSVVQVYYVSNQTSGAFTVTFKTAGVGTTVSIPTGGNAVLFCDGLNVVNAATTVAGISALVLAQGSNTAPSIAYSGDTSTGIYQPASGQVAVTLLGVQKARFDASGLTLVNALAVGGAGSFGSNVTAATAPTLPAHLANKAYVDAQVSGGGFLPLTGGSGTPMTGTAYSNVSEAWRINNDTAYISGFNAAGTTRAGYVQFNTSAGLVVLGTDTGAPNGIAFYTAGGEKARITGGGDFLVAHSQPGGIVQTSVTNSSSAANSDTRHVISVTGGTSGDPHILFDIAGVMDWYWGIDNSDGDQLVWGTGTAVGTNARMRLDTNGNFAVSGGVSGAQGSFAVPGASVAGRFLSTSGATGTYVVFGYNSGANPEGYIGGADQLISGGNVVNFALRAENAFTFGVGANAVGGWNGNTFNSNFTVGSTATSFPLANRSTITIDGSTSAVLGFRTGGADKAYLFYDNPGTFELATVNNVTLNLRAGSGPTLAGTSAAWTYGGVEIGWRGIPDSLVTSGSLASGNQGKMVYQAGTITVPGGVFGVGDIIPGNNYSGSGKQIVAGTGMTIYYGATGRGTGVPWNIAQGTMWCLTFFNSATAILTGGPGAIS